MATPSIPTGEEDLIHHEEQPRRSLAQRPDARSIMDSVILEVETLANLAFRCLLLFSGLLAQERILFSPSRDSNDDVTEALFEISNDLEGQVHSRHFGDPSGATRQSEPTIQARKSHQVTTQGRSSWTLQANSETGFIATTPMLMYGRLHGRVVARGVRGSFSAILPRIAALAKQSAPFALRASLVQAGLGWRSERCWRTTVNRCSVCSVCSMRDHHCLRLAQWPSRLNGLVFGEAWVC
ncbi:hypothetical protein BKA56DRAFT_187071 [Ilyonectria sp. MPI-CAGE-AT-0026]|nr:hypothetical protein BKA56DRAFT_187071 [Ilyonectria sp. MPI-CAGE-AT-0026]